MYEFKISETIFIKQIEASLKLKFKVQRPTFIVSIYIAVV